MTAQILEKYLNSVRSCLPEAQRDDIVQELSENLHAQIEDKENELGRPLQRCGSRRDFEAARPSDGRGEPLQPGKAQRRIRSRAHRAGGLPFLRSRL